MSHHTMYIDEPYFSLIKSGKKPVEGRKNSPTWSKIKPGDLIEIECSGKESFTVLVTGITKYISEDPLHDYLVGETLDRCLPGIKTIDEGKKIYLQWSTKEEIIKCGMMGIQVKVI